MAIQKAKSFLIKIETATPGVFQTVAGLRARALNLNATSVDVTHQESASEWRELLAGSGIKSASVTGSGVFKDDASDAEMRLAFFGQETRGFQIVIPDFGTLEGPFKITALEYSGSHDGELGFSMTLASAGALGFTAL